MNLGEEQKELQVEPLEWPVKREPQQVPVAEPAEVGRGRRAEVSR